MDDLNKNTINQIINDIENSLDILKQNKYFLFNNYDYHHKAKSVEVLQKKRDELEEARAIYNANLGKLLDLQTSLAQAEQLAKQADALILELGINSMTLADENTKPDTDTQSD